MSNPLGHGLGVGGNQSAAAQAEFKMDGPGGFTHVGADFALESAVGVLLYQTGIASSLVFAVFIAVLSAGPLGELRGNQLRPLRQDIMFFAVATIMVNGVFQEEAYTPYAAGLIMLLCSCAIANGRRPHAVYKSVVRRFAYKDTFARPGEIAAITPGMSGRRPPCNRCLRRQASAGCYFVAKLGVPDAACCSTQAGDQEKEGALRPAHAALILDVFRGPAAFPTVSPGTASLRVRGNFATAACENCRHGTRRQHGRQNRSHQTEQDSALQSCQKAKGSSG